jgi:predicted dienelactone hydrolase
MKHLGNVDMDVVWKGDLSKNYTKDGSHLIPIVYCHGLGSNRTMHSGSCRDFASHGYIVFVIDFSDKTSSYIESADGKGTFYDNSAIL